MTNISSQTFDEEWALYDSRNLVISDCTFDGPADGENVLRESSRRMLMEDTNAVSEYFMMRSKDLTFRNVTLQGKKNSSILKAPCLKAVRLRQRMLSGMVYQWSDPQKLQDHRNTAFLLLYQSETDPHAHGQALVSTCHS